MAEITELIDEELNKMAELRDLRKNINALLEETKEYKATYESLIEMEGLNVSTKSAKTQALKLAYDHFKPKDEED